LLGSLLSEVEKITHLEEKRRNENERR